MGHDPEVIRAKISEGSPFGPPTPRRLGPKVWRTVHLDYSPEAIRAVRLWRAVRRSLGPGGVTILNSIAPIHPAQGDETRSPLAGGRVLAERGSRPRAPERPSPHPRPAPARPAAAAAGCVVQDANTGGESAGWPRQLVSRVGGLGRAPLTAWRARSLTSSSKMVHWPGGKPAAARPWPAALQSQTSLASQRWQWR